MMAILAGKLEARRADCGQVDAEPAGAESPEATRYHRISPLWPGNTADVTALVPVIES